MEYVKVLINEQQAAAGSSRGVLAVSPEPTKTIIHTKIRESTHQKNFPGINSECGTLCQGGGAGRVLIAAIQLVNTSRVPVYTSSHLELLHLAR